MPAVLVLAESGCAGQLLSGRESEIGAAAGAGRLWAKPTGARSEAPRVRAALPRERLRPPCAESTGLAGVKLRGDVSPERKLCNEN